MRQEKEIRGTQNWVERNKTVFVLRWHDCLCSKSKSIIRKKVLKLTSDYKKAAEYKIYIWKSTAFLYTSNEQVEFVIKNTMHLN